MRKPLIVVFIASVLLALLAVDHYFAFFDKKLHVVFCDVGQGDAIFIRTPQASDILIDGGGDKKVLDCLSRNMPFWDREIDLVVLTHPDADHLTGLIDVVRRYEVGEFYTPNVESKTDINKLLRLVLAEKKLSARNSYKDDVFRDKSGVEIKTLWPSLDALRLSDLNTSNNDLNALSVVQLLSYGNFKALLTGDGEAKVEDLVVSDAGDVDILKLPHHGSAGGMSEYSLSITNPNLAIISAGKNNRYGHPAKKTMDLLESFGINSLRTDISGDIEIISDGKAWYVKKQND